MRLLMRFVVLAMLFAVNFAAVRVAAQESDTPFIYYYSPADRAIIIERADGTDRHYIRNPQLPDDHDQIFGLQWSPSGQWLAWQSGKTRQGPYRWIEEGTQIGWISKFDSSVTLQIPSPNPLALIWSPTQDVLMVKSRTPFSSQHIETVFSVLDLDVLLSVNKRADLLWSPDGNFVYEFDTEREANYTLRLYDLNGHSFDRPFTGASLWMPDNRLLYQVTDQSAILEDLYSNQTTTIALSLPPISDIVWSSDNRYALTYTRNPPNETLPYEGYSIWLFDSTNYTLQLIEGRATPRLTWEFGIGSSTLLNNWVPTDDRVIFSTIAGEVYWVDIPSLTRIQVNLPLRPVDQPEYPLLGTQWQTGDYPSVLSWGGEVWEYDLKTDTLPDNPILARWHYALSNSGQYLAFIGGCDSKFDHAYLDVGKCVVNRETDEEVEFPRNRLNERVYVKLQFSDLNWYQTMDWIILGEDGGLSNPQYYYSVAHASGIVYRDIAACYDEFACVQWLPTNVPIPN